MSSNLVDIHAIQFAKIVAAPKPHKLERPLIVYPQEIVNLNEPLDTETAFVSPDNPTSTFNPTAEVQAPFTGAPPFAPGGPMNPYPASAGMAAPSISVNMQANQMPTNIPGQPGFDPLQPVYQVPLGPGLSAAGGMGSATIPPPAQQAMTQPPRLPGRVPGPFQPGGGQPKMPNQPMPQPRMGNPNPVQNPTPYPQQPPPPIMPPGSGQTGAKPRGFRVLPMPERHRPPLEPPKPPGQWITVDAGKGMPPAYGFLTQTQETEAGVDTGLEGPSVHSGPYSHERSSTTGRPTGEKSGEKGHYVPILLAGGNEEEPAWVWIPEIDAEYGVRRYEREEEREKPRVNPLSK